MRVDLLTYARNLGILDYVPDVFRNILPGLLCMSQSIHSKLYRLLPLVNRKSYKSGAPDEARSLERGSSS